MAYEDFTTYDETDEGGNVTVIASKVSWQDLARTHTAHVSKSKGANHFNGDFAHKFECLFNDVSSNALVYFWGLANTQADVKTLVDASADALLFCHYQDGILRLRILENGVLNTDEWTGAVAGTNYYVTITRDDDAGANGTGQLKAYIRTGSHEGELKDTLTVDCGVGEQNDFEFIFGLLSYDDGIANSADGFTQNLDLQEAAGAAIVESATADAEESAIGIFNAAITEAAAASETEDGSRIYSAEMTEAAEAIEVEDASTAKVYVSEIVEAASAIDAQDSYAVYTEIPPFMHKDLIDPYSGGAWLWLCEIAVPGYDQQNIARNTADVCHAGKDYTKHNVRIGKQPFVSDGRIPRIILQVGQDPDRAIEEIVNASEGCYNGTAKLIRVNEKFLDCEVKALEADYGMLVAESDWEWVTFTLGIPNPLTQRIPLRIGSSKICPWAIPELFKGAECQYVGEETSCTGMIEDCRDNKDNAVHWGGELGLDPNVTRI